LAVSWLEESIMLYIHLYGRLQLFYHERPFTFTAPPKTLPLWVYLLLHRTQPISRDILAFTLWPDVLETEAKGNLRRHLHQLQQALPPPEPDRPWLLREAGRLQWNPAASYWLDVAEFERLSGVADYLGKAVALYSGDLLPELDEVWLIPHRERLRNQFFATVSRLVTRCHVRRDLAQAIAYAQQALNQDPLREEMVRWLLRLYYETGDRAAALQLYRHFTQLLERELGVPPLAETVAVYQAIVENAPIPETGWQPPVAITPPHNLPAQLTPFFGRTLDLLVLQEMLTTPQAMVRLLTLTGPGGSGKTRLALETAVRLLSDQAHHFPDGIYLVDLAAVTAPELVAATIADIVGVKERGDQSPVESLKSHLSSRYMLLLLDNFEQVVAAAPQIVALLAAAPGLKIVVTSRIPLQLYGEHEYPVPPLPLPDLSPDHPASQLPPAAELLEYAAISLFVARARAANSDFTLTPENAPLVAEICIRLDGLPLAIELAAARSKHFSLAGIRARLVDSLSFLASWAGNIPARQQTIQATIEWSYTLLAVDERELFASLAVFSGEFTLDAAIAVITAVADGGLSEFEGQDSAISYQTAEDTALAVKAGLTALVDKNMVRQVAPQGDEDQPRFRLLFVLREYALERLAQVPAADTLRQHHAHYYLALAEAAPAQYHTPEQARWLKRLNKTRGNLRTALTWFLEQSFRHDNREAGARLVQALAPLWQRRGRINELRGWLDQVLVAAGPLSPILQLRLFNLAGWLAQLQGDYTVAKQFHDEALALAQSHEDSYRVAKTLQFLGTAAGRQGEYGQAEALLSESLALYRQSDKATAQELAPLINNLAIVARRLGEYSQATALLEECLAMAQATGSHSFIASALGNLGTLATQQEKYTEAASYHRQSLELRQAAGNKVGIKNSLGNLAELAVAVGAYLRAARLYAAADTLRHTMHTSGTDAEQVDIDRDLAVIQQHLGEDAFTAAWAVGSALTLDEAVTYALQPEPIID
jgi:predicted ATPase/DNA-binding SARP family transcriptional activator